MTLDGTGSTLGPGFTLLWTAPGIVFDELLDVESSEPDDGSATGTRRTTSRAPRSAPTTSLAETRVPHDQGGGSGGDPGDLEEAAQQAEAAAARAQDDHQAAKAALAQRTARADPRP